MGTSNLNRIIELKEDVLSTMNGETLFLFEIDDDGDIHSFTDGYSTLINNILESKIEFSEHIKQLSGNEQGEALKIINLLDNLGFIKGSEKGANGSQVDEFKTDVQEIRGEYKRLSSEIEAAASESSTTNEWQDFSGVHLT